MFLFQIVARGDGDVIHHRARHLMERHTNNLKLLPIGKIVLFKHSKTRKQYTNIMALNLATANIQPQPS